VGVIAVVYVVILIVYQKYVGNFMPGPVKTGPSHWTDVFLVVPVICFGYQVRAFHTLCSLAMGVWY
jgi:sodium-coupled neutral amino acid transporter 7/8